MFHFSKNITKDLYSKIVYRLSVTNCNFWCHSAFICMCCGSSLVPVTLDFIYLSLPSESMNAMHRIENIFCIIKMMNSISIRFHSHLNFELLGGFNGLISCIPLPSFYSMGAFFYYALCCFVYLN